MSRRLPLAAALAAAVVVAIAVAAALLSSLGGSDRHAAASTSSGSSTSPTPPPPAAGLVPATSKFPAAGVCGHATEAMLTISIEPDTPSPRCASVDDHQWLRVVNRTGDYGQTAHAVTVTWIPGHSFRLRPGESKRFPQHFGAYLAPGVHDLNVGSGYRAEVWLR